MEAREGLGPGCRARSEGFTLRALGSHGRTLSRAGT